MKNGEDMKPLYVNRTLRSSVLSSVNHGYLTGSSHMLKEVKEEHQSNLITSQAGSDFDREKDLHYPVLDLDYQCHLVPSTSKGKYHLYLDKAVVWKDYLKVLEAMADAGLIEGGYHRASEARGYTAVRAPWVRKMNLHFEENSEEVSSFPFPTRITRLKDQDLGVTELLLVSDKEGIKYSHNITRMEYLLDIERFKEENGTRSGVWVYTGEDENDLVVDELVRKGFLIPTDREFSTDRYTYKHYQYIPFPSKKVDHG